ncbi:VOC family protein [Ancylomarina longa]|uniref:VOC family protein n=1 Tax=Ancylomarina longa TaxID=2487017 RepID=A0A434AX97_9BACT|nr:VOC family protein [Ancylomarina longa]RUT79027.1 VOC family protein [Ancylomarina longa]
MIIQKLQLTTNNMEAQLQFYVGTLGFKLTTRNTTSFTFEAGETLVEFNFVNEKIVPVHFAFSVKAKDILSILEFLHERLTPINNNSNPVFSFPNWKAKSIYFYDSDKNIIEFILRKCDTCNISKLFTINNVIRVCEIGVVCANCQQAACLIQKNLKLTRFIGENKHFIPMGNSEGLLILVEYGQKKWFPTDQYAEFNRIETEILIQGKLEHLICENGLILFRNN